MKAWQEQLQSKNRALTIKADSANPGLLKGINLSERKRIYARSVDVLSVQVAIEPEGLSSWRPQCL
jgi:hypothetical protein